MEPTMNLTAWIKDSEKFGLIGMEVKTEEIVSQQIAPTLWVLNGAAIQVPKHWTQWLGSIRTEEIENCNLLVLSKMHSSAAGVLDGEDKALQQQIHRFYVGLILTSKFSPSHNPVLISGACSSGEIGVRQQQDLECPVASIIEGYPAITADTINLAAEVSVKLQELSADGRTGQYWRLFRVLDIYVKTRATQDVLERIHQYSRCIDGLILPEPGKTKQQFKSRTELFIGPKHHDLMDEIYDVRSAVEHLHENRYLEDFDRETRLELVKKEALVEYMARNSLTHVIRNDVLHGHFGNINSLRNFWSLSPQDRQSIWGDPSDPFIAVQNFDPRFISDGELGMRQLA